jgi:hypothetical protein
MRDIYVHIGLHKTATTFLQNNLFPLLTEDISYVHPVDFTKQVRDIATLDEIIFPYNEIRIEIEKIHNNEKPILISSENLSGNPGLKYINRGQIFNRLKLLYPNCKIIIGLREQWSLISSMYKLYIQNGGTKPINDYIYNKDKIYHETYFGIYNRIGLDTFNYLPLLDLLHSSFSKENIFVFNFTKFTLDSEKELTRLCNFMNTSMPQEINFNKINQSISWDAVASYRETNKFCKSYYHEGGIFSNNGRAHRLLRKYYDFKLENKSTYKEFLLLKKTDYFKEDLKLLKQKYDIEL